MTSKVKTCRNGAMEVECLVLARHTPRELLTSGCNDRRNPLDLDCQHSDLFKVTCGNSEMTPTDTASLKGCAMYIEEAYTNRNKQSREGWKNDRENIHSSDILGGERERSDNSDRCRRKLLV